MKNNFLHSKSATAKILIVGLAIIIVIGIVAGAYYVSLQMPNLFPLVSPSPTQTSASAPTQTPTSTTSPTPQPTPATVTVELSEAVAEGLVQATISGDGLEDIEVTLRSISDLPLEVTILAGTMFEAQSAGVQDMVVIEQRTVSLKSRDSVLSRSVSVACATMELDVPGENDTFVMSNVPAPEDLVKLLNLSDFHNETFRVKQFAIWTITDNPTPNEYVGLGYFGFGSGPSDEELQKIRTLFEKAGISTSKYQALQ